MKPYKFVEMDGDIDYVASERKFSGRMTKGRWKIISRWARANTRSYRCGHEWDCCGCVSSTYADAFYTKNQVTIYLVSRFNY